MKKNIHSLGLGIIFASISFGAGCLESKKNQPAPVLEKTASLYERIGGQPAIDAAVEIFYKKVLAGQAGESIFRGH